LDHVTAAPHTDEFARAVEAGGVIVWVRVTDAAAEEKAKTILAGHGASNVHLHERRA